MGLFRNRFLRQKEGSYSMTITLGELMADYNKLKSRVKVEDGGNSFLYSENMMENALRNLIDWNFMAFAKVSEKVTLMNRELTCRYGPEDIEYMYYSCSNLPFLVKQIYQDSA